MWVAKELVNTPTGTFVAATYIFDTLDNAMNWVQEYSRTFKKRKPGFVLEEQKGQP